MNTIPCDVAFEDIPDDELYDFCYEYPEDTFESYAMFILGVSPLTPCDYELLGDMCAAWIALDVKGHRTKRLREWLKRNMEDAVIDWYKEVHS